LGSIPKVPSLSRIEDGVLVSDFGSSTLATGAGIGAGSAFTALAAAFSLMGVLEGSLTPNALSSASAKETTGAGAGAGVGVAGVVGWEVASGAVTVSVDID
jgi:hypothetical protein